MLLQVAIIQGIVGDWEAASESFARIWKQIQNAETVVNFLGIDSDSRLIPVVALGCLGTSPAGFSKEVLGTVKEIENNKVIMARLAWHCRGVSPGPI